MDLDIVKVETPEQLYAFGKSLERGEVHAGVLWGIEYGWLQQKAAVKTATLKPLAITSYGDVQLKSRIMVASRENNPLLGMRDLRGKTIAVFDTLALMDRLYLQEAASKEPGANQSFFGEVRHYPSPRQAIWAVLDGEADCLPLNQMTFANVVVNQPQIKLQPLANSEEWPAPLILARPEVIESLQHGLWDLLQSNLIEAHRSHDGQTSVRFWRIDHFDIPTTQHMELIKKRVAEYPISSLTALTQGGQTAKQVPRASKPTTPAKP